VHTLSEARTDACNLPRDWQGLVDRNRATGDSRQVFALDEFHHEGVHLTSLFESVNDRDVGMVQ
jgi:hypothetical protein